MRQDLRISDDSCEIPFVHSLLLYWDFPDINAGDFEELVALIHPRASNATQLGWHGTAVSRFWGSSLVPRSFAQSGAAMLARCSMQQRKSVKHQFPTHHANRQAQISTIRCWDLPFNDWGARCQQDGVIARNPVNLPCLSQPCESCPLWEMLNDWLYFSLFFSRQGGQILSEMIFRTFNI